MTDSERLMALVAGVLVSSTLYLSGCFAAGLILNKPFAWHMALISTGFAYLSYVLQMSPPTVVNGRALAFVGSILFGAVAGLSLLFGVP